MTGQNIEDYVKGLNQDDIDDHLQMVQNLENLRKQTILMKMQGRNYSSQQQDMLGDSTILDKSLDPGVEESQDFQDLRPGTINEKRHTDFVEYLKKMGMKEYENGTVIYYEDETDVKPKQSNEDS